MLTYETNCAVWLGDFDVLRILAGEYGPRQKPWFLFTKAFWKSADKNKRMNMDMNGHYVINKGYGSFIGSTEEEPDDVEPVPASMSSKLAVRSVNSTYQTSS